MPAATIDVPVRLENVGWAIGKRRRMRVRQLVFSLISHTCTQPLMSLNRRAYLKAHEHAGLDHRGRRTDERHSNGRQRYVGVEARDT